MGDSMWRGRGRSTLITSASTPIRRCLVRYAVNARKQNVRTLPLDTASRVDWDQLQSAGGEVQVAAYKFSDGIQEAVMAPSSRDMGCGILVQLPSIRPQLRLLKCPSGFQRWETVSNTSGQVIHTQKISWQFPPNPREGSHGVYTMGDLRGMEAVSSHFLSQKGTAQLQTRMKELWLEFRQRPAVPTTATQSPGMQEVGETFRELSTPTVSLSEMIARLQNPEGKPTPMEEIVRLFLVNQIVRSTPFFSQVPETSSFFVHTHDDVIDTIKSFRFFQLWEEMKDGKQPMNHVNLKRLERWAGESTPEEAQALLDMNGNYASMGFESFSRVALAEEFTTIMRHFFLQLRGKLTGKTTDPQVLRDKIGYFLTPRQQEQISNFWLFLEDEPLAVSDHAARRAPSPLRQGKKMTQARLKRAADAFAPILLRNLIDYSMKAVHPIVQTPLERCMMSCGIGNDPAIVRGLLIAFDQLPFTYCYLTESFRRNWSDPVELLNLREQPPVRKEFHRNLKETFRLQKNEGPLPRYEKALAIDNTDTTSIDDAISITEKPGEDPWVHIHIADTSSYIPPNSFIDIQARFLSATQYFSDDFYRLLPNYVDRELTLHAGQNRVMTFSAQMREGRIVDYDVHFSEVSDITLSNYEAVQDMIHGRAPHAPFDSSTVQRMYSIARDRRHARRKDVAHLQERSSNLDSEILVEEFMVIAGDVSSRFCQEHDIPCFFRTQEPIHRDILRRLERSHPLMMESSLMRMMPSAGYSTKPGGHFLVGLDSYSHVTSPLRRYVDMIAHFQISAFLHRQEFPFSENELEAMSFRLNERSKSIKRTERGQKIQNLQYFLSETGDTDIKGFVRGVSVHKTTGTTQIEFAPLLEEDLRNIRLVVDAGYAWPGRFQLGDVYELSVSLFPHNSTSFVQLRSSSPVSTLEEEAPMPSEEQTSQHLFVEKE